MQKRYQSLPDKAEMHRIDRTFRLSSSWAQIDTTVTDHNIMTYDSCVNVRESGTEISQCWDWSIPVKQDHSRIVFSI